jgi:hypothetical protein
MISSILSMLRFLMEAGQLFLETILNDLQELHQVIQEHKM